MKLTKDELKELLNAQTEWHLDNAEFLRSQGFSGKENDDLYERYEALLNKLEDGTLEIEGYERTEWTRFDPQNPNTFPPKNEYLDVFEHHKKNKWRAVNMLTEFWWQRLVEEWSISVNSRGYTIYWRPLPPPPGKEAKQ